MRNYSRLNMAKFTSGILCAASAIFLAFLVGCSGDLPTPGEEYSSSSSGNNSGGNVTTKPTITIKNSTGYYLYYIWIKSPESADWGSYDYLWLDDGESKTYTFSKSLSEQSVYDIRVESSSGGNYFVKYNFSVTDGMIINFTASDLKDGGDLPTISIQNRIGVSANNIYIKPSASSDWGTSLGSVSNNSSKSITIPIPPSSYTTFDIQITSSNPSATYTKKNVKISGDEVLTFTRADADNSLIGSSPVIVINNNTGYYLYYIWIKSPESADWGSYDYLWLDDGESKTYTFSKSLSEQSVYDIRVESSSGGNYFVKYNFSVTDGMIINFTASDLKDGGDLPTISIQNRIGVSANNIYIKPSASSDWGTSLGSVSNNSSKSITIPIPPSSYTTFDIQITSSNPSATYTKKNVKISGGEVLTFTRADADNSLIGSSPVIVINNNTGYYLYYIWIKSPESADWGSYDYLWLDDGESKTYTFSKSLSEQSVYDIRVESSSGGNYFVKYNFSVTDGMIINFNEGDLE